MCDGRNFDQQGSRSDEEWDHPGVKAVARQSQAKWYLKDMPCRGRKFVLTVIQQMRCERRLFEGHRGCSQRGSSQVHRLKYLRSVEMALRGFYT